MTLTVTGDDEISSLREIARCARGVLRTAHPDIKYSVHIDGLWWKALERALDAEIKRPLDFEPKPGVNYIEPEHTHMTADGFWEEDVEEFYAEKELGGG